MRLKSSSSSSLGRATAEPGELLPQRFFARDALDVAPALLGMYLVREDVVLRITEVEAYRWPGDSACHARFGKTARNAVMWEAGGRAYVYLCYGLHMMLNVVTGRLGEPSAVLIRACEPEAGLSTIEARRPRASGRALLTGPGRVGAALGLDTSWSGHELYRPGGLELRRGPSPGSIRVGPRVGIDYAEPEHRSALWRFAAGDTQWVTEPKTLTEM